MGKGNFITWAETLELIEAGEIKLIGGELEEFKTFINTERVDYYTKQPVDFLNAPIHTDTEYDVVYDNISFNFKVGAVVVYDGALNPIVIIREYEISNPYVFNNMVVVPGHDSITCYDKITGESSTNHIR